MARKKQPAPEGYKFCPSCKITLPHWDFSKSNTTSDKLASSCRHCYAYYRKHHTMPNQPKEVKPVLPNMAQVRTFVSVGKYIPEQCYTRNNGNKHILSRGV